MQTRKMILNKVIELVDSPPSKPEPSDSRFRYFMFQRSEKWENGIVWFGIY